MLYQLRLYRNKVHFANLPVQVLLDGAAQVPWDVIDAMVGFAKGETAVTRLREWSWEWMELPKHAPRLIGRWHR